jgi:hypothetical protein
MVYAAGAVWTLLCLVLYFFITNRNSDAAA